MHGQLSLKGSLPMGVVLLVYYMVLHGLLLMECGLIHAEDVEGMCILFLVRWLLRHDLIHEVRHQIRREGIILSYVVAIFGNTPSPMSKAMLAIDDDLLQAALDRLECAYGNHD